MKTIPEKSKYYISCDGYLCLTTVPKKYAKPIVAIVVGVKETHMFKLQVILSKDK